MSFDPISALFDLGKTTIEKIWPDANKRAEQLVILEELRQKGDLAEMAAQVKLLTNQMDINMEEAKHKSIFVAGWRPFVGWVGGFSLAYVSIIEPIMRFVAIMAGYEGEFPIINTELTIQVLLGMLGIGAMRSFDKSKGTQTDNVKN